MYVYIWKHHDVPFYVGMSKTMRRTDPLAANPRGWFCKQKLEQVGANNVVVEIHSAPTLEDAKELERSLIEKYGRIQLGTGSLTNLRSGGEGRSSISEEEKINLSKRMKLNNPMHNPETRAKAAARMKDPHVIAKFSGDNNPSKRPEVRAKLKAQWEDPEFRAARIAEKIGRPIHSEEEKEKRRQKLLDPSNPMREYHKVLNSDPAIKEKRVTALRSPEVQAKISAALKLSWAKRKGLI